MGILGELIAFRATSLEKNKSLPTPFADTFPNKARFFKSGIWGSKLSCKLSKACVLSPQPYKRSAGVIHCTFSSSSDGNESKAENFRENDEEYVNSSVIEAVEVRSGSDGFSIKMHDGTVLRCIHHNPLGGRPPNYAPHPAIVLRMEDGSDILLPIIVMEMPSVLLMAAIRNIQIARPTMYHVVKEMIEKMGYSVQLVRVTKRVNEAYFAQIYLKKMGNEKECISFDLRPSDAINIAVRCKVPIQVNRHLAYSDGMKIVEPSKSKAYGPFSDGLLSTQLDRPDKKPCFDTKEFDMIKNLAIAIVEERYKDAAQWRDKLKQLRAKRKNWTA